MQVWTPNTSLQNGQYIIKKVIGGGGFGETYLAEDTEENRLVVIKTLNREQREKPDFAERQKKFRKEALDLSKCYHPHIVQVYDNFPEDGLWAIVMEHIDGDDLAAYVENYTAENGYLSETEALRYIDQIGQALECVHERKLLHRDVKPNNILLRRESKEAVLIDFGLAREFQPGKIRSMTATKTEGYALQVLDGLIYTHNVEVPYVKLADGRLGKGKGLVHRDLKPNNIFITNVKGKMVAKIGDYGLSKAFDLAGLSGHTFTGATMGTPAFMCRQQLLDLKNSLPEVDVWASAACLYNMLTGDFPRDFVGEPWNCVLRNDPVPIRQRNSSIPEKLAEVIDLALVEKPKIYFQTADEFKAALVKCV